MNRLHVRGLTALLASLSLATTLALTAGCPSAERSSPGGAPAGAAEKGESQSEYGKDPPFDAVAVNGPIFEGWTPPMVALVFTGEQNGYLEPCGCTGREQQKGGISRRYSMLEERRSAGWPIVPLDLGGQIQRFGPQAEMKFARSIDALSAMAYQAIGLGPFDLRLPGDALLATTALDSQGKSLFVSANVKFLLDESLVQPFRLIVVGDLKLAVTGVLGSAQQREVNNPDVAVESPSEALRALWPRMAESSDVQVLLSFAELAESQTLAREFPEFDVVVSAGGADEPPREPTPLEGLDTLLVEVGHKGMYAAVVGLYDDPKQPWRYQRVPLDSRFADPAPMREVMREYQEQLRLAGFETLVGTPSPHPRVNQADPLTGSFSGAQACRDCHKKAFAVWEKSKHAHATQSLAIATPPRQFDPECVSCHVTGWEPQEYRPYASGYRSMTETPLLAANGCENCHGPAAAHAAVETARQAKQARYRDELRAQLRLTKATAELQVCRNCHDHDNSPTFDFATYWPKVEHKGKD